MMIRNLLLAGFMLFFGFSQAQMVIGPTYFYDDFSGNMDSSEISYTTLYPEVYTMTRDTANNRLQVDVTPQPGFWRPMVLGFENANGGARLDLSGDATLKIHIEVPGSSPKPLKLTMYISDGNTLGEYNTISGEDYAEVGLPAGTDQVFEYDWDGAEQVTDWFVWPPATSGAPNLSSIATYGFSMNTNSYDTATYYIKSIEIGNLALAIDEEPESEIRVYPNPATGNSIHLSQVYSDIVVYNLLGNEVARFKNTNQIDITGIARGSYVLWCDDRAIKFIRQ